MRGKYSRWIPIFCAALTLVIFKTVLFVGYVPSSSMEPTLPKNSIILGLRLYDELEAGDIIIFRHDGKLLVKRIAAVGGEQIEHGSGEITIPAMSYYVLGDNAENSFDSRYWEEPFVRADDVIACLVRGVLR